MSAVMPWLAGGISSDLGALELASHRLDPRGFGGGEIVGGYEAAHRPEVPAEVAGDLAAVHRLAAPFRDPLQGSGERGIAHDFARRWRPAVLEAVAGGAGVARQAIGLLLPVESDARRDGDAVERQAGSPAPAPRRDSCCRISQAACPRHRRRPERSPNECRRDRCPAGSGPAATQVWRPFLPGPNR